MMLTPTGQALQKVLDGPFHELKQKWRDTVEAKDFLRSPSLPMDQARAWVLEHLVALSQRGFVTAGYPGHKGSVSESVAGFEMLAMGDGSLNIKSGVQHGLFGGAVTNLGTSWHHETFIDDIVACRLPGCFGMTEMAHGSDVQSVETTITYLPETDEYEVNTPRYEARKAYIGNAALHGQMCVVFGQLIVDGQNHGVHAVMVPIRDKKSQVLPGISIEDHGHKGGLVGIDNGTIAFDHIRVPRQMLLDRFGGVNEQGKYESPIESKSARFFTQIGTLVRGRICVGSGAAVVARKALSIATRYALQRTQFRKPGLGEEILLMDYRSHQRKLIPNIAKAYAYGFAIHELTGQLQLIHDGNGKDVEGAREIETRAAGLKSLLTWWANETIQTCREACGGAGFISENGLTLLRQDADICATFEGDNTVLMQLVAKALLLDYKKSWGEMDMRGTAQATAKLLGTRFMERTVAGNTINRLIDAAQLKPESEKVLARGWQLELFEYRERHVVESLARRMRSAAKAPADQAFEAVNDCQLHMIEAGYAHTERIVLEAFVAAISRCSDDYVKALLIRLCDLFALSTIEDNRAWYLEHGGITPERSKAVREAVDKLCRELRPKVLELVEGFGIPVEWLNSAMLVPQDEAPAGESEVVVETEAEVEPARAEPVAVG